MRLPVTLELPTDALREYPAAAHGGNAICVITFVPTGPLSTYAHVSVVLLL